MAEYINQWLSKWQVKSKESFNLDDELIKTIKITTFDKKEILRLLKSFTHTEIREGKYIWAVFIPGDFNKLRYNKIL